MATTTQSTVSDLAGALGKLDVKSKDLVTKCEKVVAKDENHCHTDLAISFGDKPAEWIQMIDEKLQIAAASALKNINAIDKKERTWDKIVSVLQNLPILQSIPQEDVHHEESFSTEQEGIVTGQEYDEVTATKVIAWFRNLINDPEVLKATPINIQDLAALLARVGTKLGFHLSTQKVVTKKNIVDIGVLRFPDLNDPYIKLYRIEVMLVVENKLSALHATDRGVICGGYHCRKYKPNAELIELVSAEAKKKAVAYTQAALLNDF